MIERFVKGDGPSPPPSNKDGVPDFMKKKGKKDHKEPDGDESGGGSDDDDDEPGDDGDDGGDDEGVFDRDGDRKPDKGYENAKRGFDKLREKPETKKAIPALLAAAAGTAGRAAASGVGSAVANKVMNSGGSGSDGTSTSGANDMDKGCSIAPTRKALKGS